MTTGIDHAEPTASRQRVIIESPYAGNTKRNKAYLHAAVLHSLGLGESPYASHGFFTQFLNDNIKLERHLGIEAGFTWHYAASLSAVYEDFGISQGMTYGILTAQQAKIPIQHRKIIENGKLLIPQQFKHYHDILAYQIFEGA